MRITQKELERCAATINSLTNSPKEYRSENGINIGHYYINCAYGGYALYRITNNGGAVKDVSDIGHVPARELHSFLIGYIGGLDFKRKDSEGFI